MLPLYTIFLFIHVKPLLYFHEQFRKYHLEATILWKPNNKGSCLWLFFPDTPSELLQRPIIERLNWSAWRLMRWFDLISSIIFSFSLVHAFNSSYLNEFRGPMEPLALHVRERDMWFGRTWTGGSELQRDCAVGEVAFHWETRSFASVLCAKKNGICLSPVHNGLDTHVR